MRLHSVDTRGMVLFRGDACKFGGSEHTKALDGEAWRALTPRE